jgi:hypothetical protein
MIIGTAIPEEALVARWRHGQGETMDLHVEQWLVDQVIPYVRNPRTHTPEQIAQVAGSIAEFGFVNRFWLGPIG